MKLRITISKYHSWYLCQISLLIMLLPVQMSAETRCMAVIDNHCMSLTKKRIILSCFRKWKSRERIKQLARIDKYGKLRTRKKEKRKKNWSCQRKPNRVKATCKRMQRLPPLLAQQCWALLCPFARSQKVDWFQLLDNNSLTQQHATGRANGSNT